MTYIMILGNTIIGNNKTIAIFGVRSIPWIGGIENVISSIGPIFVRNGFNVRIYVKSHWHQNKSLDYHGCKLVKIPTAKGKHLESFVHTFLSTFHALFTGCNVFYYNAVPLGFFTIFPRIWGKKIIFQTHGLDWKREKWNNYAKYYMKLSIHVGRYCSSNVSTVGLQDYLYFKSKFNMRVTLIPNGVNKPFLKQDRLYLNSLGLEKNKYFLFMSRLVPEKGAHTLIQAWEKLNNKNKKGIKLVIAGDTYQHDAYYNKLIKSNSSDIIFTGFVNGVMKSTLLINSLCFIQPSTIEGMSTGLIEAMSYGLPTISSDIGENIEVASDFGIYFKTKNSIDLNYKIIQVIQGLEFYSSCELKKKISNYALKKYNWEKSGVLFVKKLLTNV